MLDALKGVFIDLDKQQKQYQMELSFVKQGQLDLCTGEFIKSRNICFTVDETTKCGKCDANIDLFPFTFNPENAEIIHTHHIH